MYKAESSTSISKGYAFYKFLLTLYPGMYRKRFAEEMLITFQDIYEEKLLRDGNTGVIFWLSLFLDILQSALEQHYNLFKKQGMKKYLIQTLHINIYNIIGGILLLPFFSIFLIDVIARIAQGDLTHYNRPVYALLSHSLFYWFPVLFTWVFLFPFLAILLNVIPLIKNFRKNHGHVKNIHFFAQNFITILLLLCAIFFILLVKFHDFGPCMFHGIARLGFMQLTHIIAVCKNA